MPPGSGSPELQLPGFTPEQPGAPLGPPVHPEPPLPPEPELEQQMPPPPPEQPAGASDAAAARRHSRNPASGPFGPFRITCSVLKKDGSMRLQATC
eukprot:2958822-Pyramimonas_sp.AAC.1